jgi:glutamate synthase (NADPH/NADH) small chain
MGKASGFLEYERKPNAWRPALARVRDWAEFHEAEAEPLLRQQAARCMDCGVPFCHTGVVINGAASGCPVNNLIPEWNDLVYHGRWREALERLLQTNDFPEFTGRVCPAPCEGSCVLGINDAPVTIKTIEQAIIDRGFDAGWVKARVPQARSKKSVAVVGSGPAGLACANQLNQSGHTVTVFERADRAGGLLMYGIPNMKLDKSVVERRLDLMTAEGISFVTNVNVGRDYGADQLTTRFDAIALCGGATRPRDLAIEGRSLSGIYFAMDFLHQNTRSLLNTSHRDGRYVSAKDKDVVVIGGGDTGTDCVGTALRQGCRSLVQFEILPRPPQERTPDNPWPQWPKVHRLDYGHEEAAALQGRDPRAFSLLSERFLADEHGCVRGVQTVEVERAHDIGGHSQLQPVAGSVKQWPAQLVLLALGFLGPETDGIISQLGVAIDQRGNVGVASNQMTNIPKVFAAGDMSRGQSLVVWAIADGRRAAQGINEFLRREAVLHR